VALPEGAAIARVAAVAIEGFFHYGERWRHYRRTSELLKSQGWQFFELAGPYEGHRTHRTAFRAFASTVEGLIAEDVVIQIQRSPSRGGRKGQQLRSAEAALAERASAALSDARSRQP